MYLFPALVFHGTAVNCEFLIGLIGLVSYLDLILTL